MHKGKQRQYSISYELRLGETRKSGPTVKPFHVVRCVWQRN